MWMIEPRPSAVRGWASSANEAELIPKVDVRVTTASAAAAKRQGKIAGRLATTAAEIGRCVAQGFLFIQAGTELNFMAAGARQLLGTMGENSTDTAGTPY